MNGKARSAILVLAVVLLAAVVCPAAGTPAQARADREDVLALLESFPARNAEERDRLASEILERGGEAVEEICGRLAAPGPVDDSQARFALGALAVYAAGDRARESARRAFVRAVLRSLEREKSTEVRSFLLSLLQVAGKNEVIKPLRRFLTRGELCGPACRVFQAVGSPEAEKALIKGLAVTRGKNRVAVVQALGEMGSRRAVKKLLPLARSDDPDLRRVALFALARSGDPAAGKALSAVPLAAPAYERARAPSLYLLYARRLAENGYRAQALGICRRLLRSYTAPGESHVASNALSLILEAWGEKAFDYLLQAVDSPFRDLRQRALELALSIPGEEATGRWLEKLEAVPPEVQAQVVSMLGRRGDASALPALKEKLESADLDVRLAAVAAVARLEGEDALPDLLPLLHTDDPDQVAAVRKELLGFSGERVVPEAVRMLDEVPPTAQAALVEVLAAKQAREHAERVFALAGSGEETVRRAALEALASLVDAEDLPRLVDMMGEAEGREAVLLQRAVVAASLRIPDPEQRAEVLLRKLESAGAEKKAVFLRPLSRIGGEQALRAVVAETQSPDAGVKTAAVAVLAEWPTLDAAPELLRICRETGDRKHLLLAAGGYARLVRESELSEREKLLRLQELLEASDDPGAAGPALDVLGGLGTGDAFRTAVSYLDRPGLERRAAAAVARIALSSPEETFGMTVGERISILHRAANLVEADSFRLRLDRVVGELLVKEGFVPLFNGRDLTGWKGLVGNPVERAGMSAEELAEAQSRADEVMRAHWRAEDGVLLFDGKGENLCTAEDYGDFELLVDWKIEPGGDSGIYLRGAPQVQIWDPARWPEGSGGLYNNKVHPNKPLRRADRPVGEWNTFRILMVGDRVTVHLNGVLVVDGVVMENYWERDKPIYPTGPVELQAHNTPLSFRNIYIREIPRR